MVFHIYLTKQLFLFDNIQYRRFFGGHLLFQFRFFDSFIFSHTILLIIIFSNITLVEHYYFFEPNNYPTFRT